MTSLLTSIFGETAAKASEKEDLFANPVAPPPPLPLEPPTKKRKKGKDQQEPEKKDSKDDPTPGDSEEAVDAATVPTVPNKPPADPHADDDRTVFVGNLPVGTTRKDLQRYFRECGKIRSTRLRSVATDMEKAVKLPPHQAGNQKLVQQILVNQRQLVADAKASVQGYVVFEDTESVENALALNNKPIPVKQKDKSEDGEAESSVATTTRRMRVDRVNKEYDARRSVFIGNLPYQADEESLRATFVEACPDWKDEDIEGVRIVRDKETHKCKGFGYLLMKDVSMVATALRSMDGTDYMGRPLRVRVCGKRFKTRGADPAAAAPKPKKEKPVVAALKQMVTKEQHQAKQNKRKRGSGKKTPSGKSKRAESEAKTNQRIKKIEKRIRNGMGKMRAK
eukprot:scaffold1291_cov136-Amphora_coffeaeformis.AAC.7